MFTEGFLETCPFVHKLIWRLKTQVTNPLERIVQNDAHHK